MVTECRRRTGTYKNKLCPRHADPVGARTQLLNLRGTTRTAPQRRAEVNEMHSVVSTRMMTPFSQGNLFYRNLGQSPRDFRDDEPMTTASSPDQFYTGLVARAYAPLRGDPAPAEPYERFVRRWGEPALEIGCGHGEPILDLVAAGIDVTGIDSSADMLRLAEEEAKRRGLTVTLLCQRMEELNVDRSFSSIYFAGPTFQLVIDRDAALATLRRISLHLTADGRALIPLFVPQPITPEDLGVWREHVTDAGEILAFHVSAQSYRPDDRRVDSTLRYRRGPADQPTEVVERLWSLCWYNDGEFERLASEGGLDVDRVLDHGAAGQSFVLRHQHR